MGWSMIALIVMQMVFNLSFVFFYLYRTVVLVGKKTVNTVKHELAKLKPKPKIERQDAFYVKKSNKPI